MFDWGEAVFAYMAKGKYEKEEIRQIRQDLLEVDTLTMVKLHERLVEML